MIEFSGTPVFLIVVRLRKRFVYDRQALSGLHGAKEPQCHEAEKYPISLNKPRPANFIYRRTEKSEPGDDITSADRYCTVDAASPRVPGVETMLCRVFKQDGRICFDAGEIADSEADRTCGIGQRNTQRKRMTNRSSCLDAALRHADGLLWKSFKPKNSRQVNLSQTPLVELKPEDL